VIDPVLNTGGTPAYPLQPCYCSNSTCDAVVDANYLLVYDNTNLHGLSTPLKWVDIQNEPGWVNGYPPWMVNYCPPAGTVDITSFTFSPTAKYLEGDKCDCGAAASDYCISRDGGPGHSDWCRVANK
jgi:hypothetical protein